MSAHEIFDGGQARIIDRGYRRYDGDRTGIRGAISATVRHSVQRSLGMRRTIWAKVLPVAGIAIAYIPGIVFVGVIALFKVDERRGFVQPSYGEYYRFVIAAIVVFVAFVAPEVLCTDRRSGMLGIYLSSPLDRRTYLLAKGLAVGFTLFLVCGGPPLLMLLANVLQSQGPHGLGSILLTLVRVLAAGVALTLLYTGISMGVSSLTDRKMIATAGVILLILVTAMMVGTLIAGGSPIGVRALSPITLSLSVAQRVHGEQYEPLEGASSALVWGAWAAWTFGGFSLAWLRYRALEVTR